jgi:hypothetical protein
VLAAQHHNEVVDHASQLLRIGGGCGGVAAHAYTISGWKLLWQRVPTVTAVARAVAAHVTGFTRKMIVLFGIQVRSHHACAHTVGMTPYAVSMMPPLAGAPIRRALTTAAKAPPGAGFLCLVGGEDLS